ncbi:biotin synthase BioB [Dethiosulfovibrio salsuginis]|nr:biotin synthase BioB [Dethiosulfovibrio salsuginis]
MKSEDLLELLNLDLDDLLARAYEVRCQRGAVVELCSIVNAKSGCCSEDCVFCAQSGRWGYSGPKAMITKDQALSVGYRCLESGISRLSLVTSGRSLSDREVDFFCSIYESLSEIGIGLCGSHGLLSEPQMRRLATSGLSRYHCNLETGPRFFPQICATHGFMDKIETLKVARGCGLELCSGGLWGLGEGDLDRAEMVLALRELKVESVPINCLIPVGGTPMEGASPPRVDTVLRWGAVAQIALPWATIRYAGGRSCLGEQVSRGLKGGIGGLLTGDYLTTSGSDVSKDVGLIRSLGLKLSNF